MINIFNFAAVEILFSLLPNKDFWHELPELE